MLTPYARQLDVAKQAAQTAGVLHVSSYGRSDLHIDHKSNPKDLVTNVDRSCDEIICHAIREAFANDTLLTEESFHEGQPIDLTRAWVVDPLDGTTNYAHGFPHFAVSIAYVENGQPKIAVIWDALRQEMFTAEVGQGAYFNGMRIQVSSCRELALALLSTGFPPNQTAQDNFEHFIRLTRASHGVRRAGAATLDLAYVACGRLDGFWEPGLAPWDVAAGALLVTEAGGTVSNYEGQPLNIAQRRVDIIGSGHVDLLNDIIRLRDPVACPLHDPADNSANRHKPG